MKHRIFDRTFIIAEIGGNHEGDFNYAKKLLFDAAESGADAVKFQTYKPEKIVNKVVDLDRYNHFSNFSLNDDQFVELAKISKDKKIIFMSSVWDKDSLELLDPYIEVHKIGSGDMTNYPLIKEIVKKGKPTIISTAMSTLEEISAAVNFILSIDSNILNENRLGIMQCVAMYGEPLDKYANLNVINTLKHEFPNAIIGYSDHTLGTHACNVAVGMGAKMLEIHFTDDKNRHFRDHHLSVTKDELKMLIEDIRKTENMLGSSLKKPVSDIETVSRIKEFRRACYLNKDLNKGNIITEEDLITLRPNVGIDATEYFKILGKRLERKVSKGEPLDWNYFENY